MGGCVSKKTVYNTETIIRSNIDRSTNDNNVWWILLIL